MRLPPHLRVSFQEAYKASFGVEIDAERADELAMELLDTIGLALTIRYRARIHRSGTPPLTSTPTNETMDIYSTRN
jgi:hypothetical protein